MLPRLSPRSQQIIDQAQTAARRYDQEYIDSEHILLAIAEAEGEPASQVLRSAGLTAEMVRKAIKKTLKDHVPEMVTGRLPGTMHFKNVIARAIEAAGAGKTATVEPVHLLLALSEEEGSLAAETLKAHNLDSRKIEKSLNGK